MPACNQSTLANGKEPENEDTAQNGMRRVGAVIVNGGHRGRVRECLRKQVPGVAVGIRRMNMNGPADADLERGQIVSTRPSNSVQLWGRQCRSLQGQKSLTVTSHMAGAIVRQESVVLPCCCAAVLQE